MHRHEHNLSTIFLKGVRVVIPVVNGSFVILPESA